MTGAVVISGLAEVLTAFCPFEPGMGLKPPPECVEAVPFVIVISLACVDCAAEFQKVGWRRVGRACRNSHARASMHSLAFQSTQRYVG
jgi:hypothetical protein